MPGLHFAFAGRRYVKLYQQGAGERLWGCRREKRLAAWFASGQGGCFGRSPGLHWQIFPALLDPASLCPSRTPDQSYWGESPQSSWGSSTRGASSPRFKSWPHKPSSKLLLFSRSVQSDSLWPHGLQPTRLPGPSPLSQNLLKFMSIESVIPSNHHILSHPLPLLPSIFPSIRVFSKKSVLRIRWPKDWSFSFSISPSSEYSGLISFRMDWFDLLAVQRTLKSLLQHHSSKVSILRH